MALKKHIKHAIALGAVVCATSALAVSCGDDTTEEKDKDAGTTPSGTSSLEENVAGSACKVTADCKGTGATCATSLGIGATLGIPLGADAPGGYCTAQCSTNSECGTGGVCVGAFGTVLKGQCQRGCNADSDCGRDGYICGELDLEAIAGAASDAGVPVDAGALPDLAKGCVPKPEYDQLTDEVGSQCDADTDCGDGYCAKTVPITNEPIEGGFCSGKCLEDEHCGDEGLCIGAFVNQFISRAGDCVKVCTSNADCVTPGYECPTLPANAPANTPRVCAPPAPDAGVAPDASTGSDAGVPDAGGEDVDAGEEPDAG